MHSENLDRKVKEVEAGKELNEKSKIESPFLQEQV